jgi:xanthine phosphoribosyltransferase
MADSDNAQDLYVSWNDIHLRTDTLADKLGAIAPSPGDGTSWTGIIAVTRGGMIPACLVAEKLGIKLIDTFCLMSYQHKQQGEADIYKKATEAGDGQGWLVIDDLADTGKSFQVLREHLPKAHYAAIYAKPEGAPTCHTYIKDIPQQTWIHFPWEVDAREGTPLEA